jgi:hypothetical protein
LTSVDSAHFLIPSGGSPYCHAWYYTDTDPQVRHTPLAKNATFEVPAFYLSTDESSRLVRVTSRQFATMMASNRAERIFQLTIVGGAITQVSEIFLG